MNASSSAMAKRRSARALQQGQGVPLAHVGLRPAAALAGGGGVLRGDLRRDRQEKAVAASAHVDVPPAARLKQVAEDTGVVHLL